MHRYDVDVDAPCCVERHVSWRDPCQDELPARDVEDQSPNAHRVSRTDLNLARFWSSTGSLGHFWRCQLVQKCENLWS